MIDTTKALMATILLAIAFAIGWDMSAGHQQKKWAKVTLAYQEAVGKSQAALSAANAYAATLNRAHAADLASATTFFEENREREKSLDDRRIADLSHRVTSLLVLTSRGPTSGGGLPATAAGIAKSNGAATETLAPAVAGRLARRYADYNEIVDQLTLCQSVIAIDRQK